MKIVKKLSRNIICQTWRITPKNKVIKFKPKQNNHDINDKDIVSILMGVIKMIREDERNKVIEQLKNSLK